MQYITLFDSIGQWMANNWLWVAIVIVALAAIPIVKRLARRWREASFALPTAPSLARLRPLWNRLAYFQAVGFIALLLATVYGIVLHIHWLWTICPLGCLVLLGYPGYLVRKRRVGPSVRNTFLEALSLLWVLLWSIQWII